MLKNLELPTKNLQILKQEALEQFKLYQEAQTNFVFPAAQISFEDHNDPEDQKGIKVFIEVEYNNTKFNFESIEPNHLSNIYTYLNQIPAAREKIADGETRTLTQTTTSVTTWSNKFKNSNPYSGFAVTDSEEDKFLGICVLANGEKPGTTEISRVNRADSWSQPPETIKDVVAMYGDNNQKLTKPYAGIGVTQTCTMLQYAQYLKDNKYKINNCELQAVVATARVDNPASWKTNAKAGMEVLDVDQNLKYGPQLRYQMRKLIP